MKPVAMLILSAVVLASACGPEGAPDGSDPQAPGEEDALDTSSSALVTAYIPCGTSTAFPTWTWWGTTTLDMTNSDSSGNTTLHVMYQAGAASPRYVDVRTTARVTGQWAGIAVWVTPLGWFDGAGYHACYNYAPNPSAPGLTVQSY